MSVCIHTVNASNEGSVLLSCAFTAQDSPEREKWVHALEACIRKLLRPPVQVRGGAGREEGERKVMSRRKVGRAEEEDYRQRTTKP